MAWVVWRLVVCMPVVLWSSLCEQRRSSSTRKYVVVRVRLCSRHATTYPYCCFAARRVATKRRRLKEMSLLLTTVQPTFHLCTKVGEGNL